jgi:hypothetical protein
MMHRPLPPPLLAGHGLTMIYELLVKSLYQSSNFFGSIKKMKRGAIQTGGLAISASLRNLLIQTSETSKSFATFVIGFDQINS